MPNLVAQSPAEGLLPRTIGTTHLAEYVPDAITSIAAAAGANAASFKSATGCAPPAPGRSAGKDGARVLWWGPGQWMMLGKPLETLENHALTDQSDAWALLRLSGPDAADVLARLTPVDLRPSRFKRGHTARTLLFHMSASITRVKDDAFDIMVFRSMTRTAVHDLSEAMTAVAARRAV